MKKILTALAVVAMMSAGTANALGYGSYDNSDCKGAHSDCSNDRTYNNSTTNTTTYNGRIGDTNVNNTRNVDRSVTNIDKSRDNYARGGRGGAGGDASSRSSAHGGDSSSRSGVRNSGNSNISRSGNSDVRNSNDLSNRNLNAQGQMQGQVGIVKGGDTRVSTGDVDASSRNRLSNDSNSNSNANVYIGGGRGEGGGGRTLSPTAKQHQSIDGNNSDAYNDGNNTAVDASDNSTNSVYYEGDEAQKRNPVSSAWAAPLVASEDTCMGSTSGGGQGITLGFSFATTWRDKDCVIRKDARFLHNAQHQNVALGLMCEKERVRTAVARAGSPAERLACGLNEDGTEPSTKAAATSATPSSTFDWGDED